jgi:hypothetical protein
MDYLKDYQYVTKIDKMFKLPDINLVKRDFMKIMSLLEKNENITLDTILNRDNKLVSTVLFNLSGILEKDSFKISMASETEDYYSIWKKYCNNLNRKITYKYLKKCDEKNVMLVFAYDYEQFELYCQNDIGYIIKNFPKIIITNFEKYNYYTNYNKYLMGMRDVVFGMNSSYLDKFNDLIVNLFRKKYSYIVFYRTEYNFSTLIKCSQKLYELLRTDEKISKFENNDYFKLFIENVLDSDDLELIKIIFNFDHVKNMFLHNKKRKRIDDNWIDDIVTKFVKNDNLRIVELLLDMIEGNIPAKNNNNDEHTVGLLHCAEYHKNQNMFDLLMKRSAQSDIESYQKTKFLTGIVPIYLNKYYTHTKMHCVTTDNKKILYLRHFAGDEYKFTQVGITQKYKLYFKSDGKNWKDTVGRITEYEIPESIISIEFVIDHQNHH